jgi:hypothetical protein
MNARTRFVVGLVDVVDGPFPIWFVRTGPGSSAAAQGGSLLHEETFV